MNRNGKRQKRIQTIKKRKQKREGLKERANRRMQPFYLAHIVLLSVFILLLGVSFASVGSEQVWRGTAGETIRFSDVRDWLEEKWDLFFDDISAKIKPQ